MLINITNSEMKELVEWAGKLSLLCSPGVIQTIHEYAFQAIAFGESHYQNLDEKQKEVWKSWMKKRYKAELKYLDFDDEACCQTLFSNISSIITDLREDMSARRLSDMEENLDMMMLDELLTLHSAEKIEIDENGDHNIVVKYGSTDR